MYMPDLCFSHIGRVLDLDNQWFTATDWYISCMSPGMAAVADHYDNSFRV